MTNTLAPTTNHTVDAAPSIPPAANQLSLMPAALYALILANSVQIAAGLAQLKLSPPEAVLPLLAATVAVGVAAVPLVRAGVRAGYRLGLLFCAFSLIGMGPHKLFLDNGLAIAPLALTGFAFEIVFVREAVRALRNQR